MTDRCPLCGRHMDAADMLAPMLLYGNEYLIDGHEVCADCTPRLDHGIGNEP